jgi:uncharacterized protein
VATSRRLLAAAAASAAAWGLFESQWVRTGHAGVAPDAPEAVRGLTILHLSDLHAGTPSLGLVALRRAIDFGVGCRPDLVAITGDILSHPRARDEVVAQVGRLRPPLGTFAVLGNHDIGASNDPFSRGALIDDWDGAPVTLLRDSSAVVAGGALEVAGLDPASWLAGTADPAALFTVPGAFRLLLCHFPEAAEELGSGAADLVLCGHLHGGQICLPTPWGKLRLAHGVHRYREGVYPGTPTVVVSRGLGTTLIPVRLGARPEVTLLRLGG